MGWKHQCRYPGSLRIALRRARDGAIWACKCGEWWQLGRRSIIPGHSHWEWRPYDEPEDPHGNDGLSESFTTTETAWREPSRDDGQRLIPDIQLGFQLEAP